MFWTFTFLLLSVFFPPDVPECGEAEGPEWGDVYVWDNCDRCPDCCSYDHP